MKKTSVILTSVLCASLLAACSNGAKQEARVMNANGVARASLAPRLVELQKYLTEANMASDKAVLTADQFAVEVQALLSGKKQNSSKNGAASAPMVRRGSGGTMSSASGFATTFWKYTNAEGHTILLAINANGQVITKWPMIPQGMSDNDETNGTMRGQPKP